MTSADVIKYIEHKYGFGWSIIQSKQRSSGVVLARQVGMWLVVKKCGYSYPQAGRLFQRDHTTVMSAVNKIDGLIFDGKVTIDGESDIENFVAHNKTDLENSFEAGFGQVLAMIKKCFRYRPMETLLAITAGLKPILKEINSVDQ